MSEKKKKFSAALRAQIALAAFKGDKTINEVAEQFDVSPQMVLKMKARLKERIEDIFQDEREKKNKSDGDVNLEELLKQMGILKYENDWLKNKLTNSVEAKRQMIEPENDLLSITRQCELIGLSRSTYYC